MFADILMCLMTFRVALAKYFLRLQSCGFESKCTLETHSYFKMKLSKTKLGQISGWKNYFLEQLEFGFWSKYHKDI